MRVQVLCGLLVAISVMAVGLSVARLMRWQLADQTSDWTAAITAMVASDLEEDHLTPHDLEAVPESEAKVHERFERLGRVLSEVKGDGVTLKLLVPDADRWKIRMRAGIPISVARVLSSDPLSVTPLEGSEPLSMDHSVTGWYEAEGLRAFASATPLKNKSGVVALTINDLVVSEYLQALFWVVIGVMLFVVGLSVPVAWWVTRRLVKPISALSDFVHRLDQGDFHARLEPFGPPELKRLMVDSITMARNLEDRSSLARHNKQLSHEVHSEKERMAAFEATEVDFAELADLDLLLRRTVESIQRTLGCECVLVLVKDESGLVVSQAKCDSIPELAAALRGQSPAAAAWAIDRIGEYEEIRLDQAAEAGLDALSNSLFAKKPLYCLPMKSGAGEVLGAFVVVGPKQSSNDSETTFTDRDAQSLRHSAAFVSMALERRDFTDQLLWRMIRMAETRDPRETAAHVRRVSGISLELFDGWAHRHGVRDEDAQFARSSLRTAAMLHDIGKVGISDAILKKPGKLTDEEYRSMKHHTVLAAAMLPGKSPQDEASREVALHHHERWDGCGYPGAVDYSTVADNVVGLLEMPLPEKGLKGYDIPLFARIVAIADVFDALSSRRAYKEPWPEFKVVETITAESGKGFDPDLVEIFLQRLHRIKAVWSAYPDPQ